MKTFAVLALLSAPLVSAVGNAIVHNNCANTVYAWSVDSSVSDRHTIKHGESYSEKLHYDDVTGGVSIKITRGKNGLYDHSPQMNFAYSLDKPGTGSRVWYDLSDVFGDPFKGHAVSVAADGNCPGICWANGVNPGGSQVKACGQDSDVELTLCADKC